MSLESDQRKKMFNTVASLYDEVRPQYPEEALDTLFEITGASERDVLEIGPGTGQLTAQLLHRGAKVTAVEPGESLAEKLQEKGSHDVLDIKVMPFEEFRPEKRYVLAIAAQSFHWVDPDIAFPILAKAVAPDGYFARIDNMKDVHTHPIRETLNELYERYFPNRDFYHQNAPEDKEQNIANRVASLKKTELFQDPRVFQYLWSEEYEVEAYIKLLSTYSDHLLLAEKERTLLFDEIRTAINSIGGSIEIPYYTLLQISKISDACNE